MNLNTILTVEILKNIMRLKKIIFRTDQQHVLVKVVGIWAVLLTIQGLRVMKF